MSSKDKISKPKTIHEIAHAYVRLALKTSNNRLHGVISDTNGYYVHRSCHNNFGLLHSISFINIYNMLAKNLDSLEEDTRFTDMFAVASNKSTLPGYDYYGGNINKESFTMLNVFNDYGLIILNKFLKSTIQKYNKELQQYRYEDCSKLFKSQLLDDAIDYSMDKVFYNPNTFIDCSEIVFTRPLSPSSAMNIINHIRENDSYTTLKNQAELYLTIYYYNKNKDFNGYTLDNPWEKFNDINNLDEEEKQYLESIKEGDELTFKQRTYIIEQNINKLSPAELVTTPKAFNFKEGTTLSKGSEVSTFEMQIDESLYNSYKAKIHSNISFEIEEELLNNENATIHQFKDYYENKSSHLLVDSNEYPVHEKLVNGEVCYFYENGERCVDNIFLKDENDDINPYFEIKEDIKYTYKDSKEGK